MPWADPASYARWLSVTQARFGQATAMMRALGLFTIAHSFGFRALLALLAGCLALRLVEGIDRLLDGRKMTGPPEEWRPLADVRLPDALEWLRSHHYRLSGESPPFQADRWPGADLLPLLAHGGALLLLVSLLVTHLWGWQAEGVIVQSGERVTLPGGGEVALGAAGSVTHTPGLVTFVEQRGPGVRASVVDGTGRPLELYQTTASATVTQLNVALTEDQYFAVPEAQMVVRLAAQQDAVLVQVYRSPPGQLITEQVVAGDAELEVEDVTLNLVASPYAQLTVTFNPGLWPSGIGILLLVAGLVGDAIWPARRFWLREEAGQVQVAGDAPPIPASGKGSRRAARRDPGWVGLRRVPGGDWAGGVGIIPPAPRNLPDRVGCRLAGGGVAAGGSGARLVE